MEAPKISLTERLILINQYETLVRLDEDNHSYHEQKAEILRRGYTGLYHDLFDGISEEVSEDVTKEVHDILSMFRTIENSIGSLPAEQQQQLNQSKLSFSGFDANNDDHYHQAKFMIQEQGLYDEYAEHDINSHTRSSLPRYQRQYALFQQLHESMQDLTFEQLKQLEAV
jgi:uncharacterized protein YfbU (UPF0304 family)